MFQKDQKSKFDEFEMVELEESAVDDVSGACLYVGRWRVFTCWKRTFLRRC